MSELKDKESVNSKQFNHYFRDVSKYSFIDIYRVLSLFNCTRPAIQHAIKKLIVPGMRTAGKTTRKDIEEAIASLNRELEMMDEDSIEDKVETSLRP